VAVPVGRPVEGTEVVLLDGDGQPTEILGEIGIRSPHVALGYWNQPELTARAFRSGERGREYRSGDLARRLGDGTLEFAGRRDDQVKVRGAGVLPAEVEQVLASHPDVAEAAVVARRDGSGETVLLAFVVTRDARPADPAKLRGFLHAHLPGHMVPSAIVGLPALPLTGSGKIDRAALPDFGSLGLPDADRDLAPPEGAVEERLAGLWSGLLGVHPVGRHDDFFALGGHSLSATRLVSRIREEFGAELPLRTVFDRPTLAALAAAIGPGPAGGPGCAGAFSPAQGDEDLIEIEF
jgi:hypothetical protein